jgi:Uma2 family endonuclease
MTSGATAMKTALRLTPADHGTRLSLEEFLEAEQQEGHHYELIHGRLYVSPLARFTSEDLIQWLVELLRQYARERPSVINGVYAPARVFTPGSDDITAPEPDIACYRGLPPRRRRRGIDWHTISPLLVVEVISEEDPSKDLVRNPPLYLSVPSIKEYWVLDPRPDPYQPTLLVHRRRGKRWHLIEVPSGGTYTTRLLPGFTLLVDPAAEE